MRNRWNSRKVAILRLLSDGRARTAGEIAFWVKPAIWPRRSVYRLLRSYVRWGLLRQEETAASRRSGPRRVLTFQITEKGRDRLRWLRAQRRAGKPWRSHRPGARRLRFHVDA